MKKSIVGGTGGAARSHGMGGRALGAIALCAAGVAVPLGCMLPVPMPGPDSGVEEDAGTPDAAGHDAAMHDGGAGDAAADQTSSDAASDGPVDGAGDAAGAPDAIEDVAPSDAAGDVATVPDAAGEDATALDSGAEDATTPDATTPDAETGDATMADAASDAPEGDATMDDGSSDAALTGDASLVITGSGFPFPEATCVTAADPETLTLSNPSDTPVPWTSSETDSFFGGFPLATLVPSSGIVPPGQSMNVILVFSLVSEPLPTQSIQIDIVSGGSTTTANYFEAVAGYMVSAPATVDFGDVPSFADFNADALETLNIDGTGVNSFGNTTFLSPCVVFNLTQSGSPFFNFASGRECSAAFGGGANVTFEFSTPIGTPPGIYQATYSFVASSFTGPPCGSPAPILLTANLLPVPDSGP